MVLDLLEEVEFGLIGVDESLRPAVTAMTSTSLARTEAAPIR